jgi:hypothetical protein
VTSVARSVGGVAGRLLPRPRERHEGYAFCPEDRFWFRPDYTEGKCPLCGAFAPGGAPPAPWLVRVDRSWLGLAVVALVSVCMSALVLFMYFEG